MWTSVSKRGHVGLNLRVLDANFMFRNFTVGCNPLACPHTGERIAEEVVAMLATVGIDPKDVASITTDSGSSALNASKKIGAGLCANISCAAHMLNLCGEKAAAQPAYKDAFAALVAVVNYFIWPKRLEALEAKQKELKLKCARFISVAPTRWNDA